MDVYLQIAQDINTEIRNLLPDDFPYEVAGRIFCTVTDSLTADRDFSKDRQCPLCRQRVILERSFTMEKFIGVKEIKAKPMTRQEYNDYRGWELPADENGADEGYLVEYLDGGQTNHPGHDGYISWSPAGVFDRAYRPVSGMTFGLAIEAMKKGHKVCRAGWNGKGMFTYLVKGRDVPRESLRNEAHFHYPLNTDTGIKICDHIDMKAADGSIVIGWLASHTDMLAEDWMIVE